MTNSTKTKPRQLKVTLAWTDRPGSATSCQKVRQSVLTNDLDLLVTGPKGTIYYPLSTAGQGADRYNPLEQITIAAPVGGGNYTITVVAYNLVTPQNYALVITGQFSGFAYNETAGDGVVDSSDLWGNFVESLHGSTAGAVLLVLFLVVLGLGLVGMCFKAPQGQRLVAEVQRRVGHGGGNGTNDAHLGVNGGAVLHGHEHSHSPPAKPVRHDDMGMRDAQRALAYVVPPTAGQARHDKDKMDLYGGL